MATQDPDLAEVIEAGFETLMSGVYTMLLGRVESYDKDSQTADVQPLQANVYVGDDDKRYAERLPVHPSVPVSFPVAGGYRIVWPLAPGDLVVLHYSSRSLSEVKASGGEESIPADDRRNHLSDPIAYPGGRVQALKYAPDGVMSLGADDNDAVIDIDIDNTEIRIGKGATQDIVVQSALDDFMTAIQQAITDTSPSGPTPSTTTNSCLTTLQAYLKALPAPFVGAPPAPVTGWKAGTTVGKAK